MSYENFTAALIYTIALSLQYCHEREAHSTGYCSVVPRNYALLPSFLCWGIHSTWFKLYYTSRVSALLASGAIKLSFI